MDLASHRYGPYRVPYGTGNCTFFYNLHDLPQKKNYMHLPKKTNSIFFLIYTTCCKKKLHTFTAKKITRLDDFFIHELHFSLLKIVKLLLMLLMMLLMMHFWPMNGKQHIQQQNLLQLHAAFWLPSCVLQHRKGPLRLWMCPNHF